MTPVAEASPFHICASDIYVCTFPQPRRFHSCTFFSPLFSFFKKGKRERFHDYGTTPRHYFAFTLLPPWRSEFLRRNLKETQPRPPTHTRTHMHTDHAPETHKPTQTHTHKNTHREFFSVKARIHIIATKGGRVLSGSPTPPHPSG